MQQTIYVISDLYIYIIIYIIIMKLDWYLTVCASAVSLINSSMNAEWGSVAGEVPSGTS